MILLPIFITHRPAAIPVGPCHVPIHHLPHTSTMNSPQSCNQAVNSTPRLRLKALICQIQAFKTDILKVSSEVDGDRALCRLPVLMAQEQSARGQLPPAVCTCSQSPGPQGASGVCLAHSTASVTPKHHLSSSSSNSKPKYQNEKGISRLPDQ